MRIIFMGTPEFALPALERLLESQHKVVAVVTQPDRPAGRGHALKPPPIKTRALEAGLPVLQPAKLRGADFHKTLAEFSADAGVVVAYGQILPPEVLAALPHGFFNIHASLLPRLRGAAPIQRAIAQGDHVTGVTIMKLDAGMDTGPIVCAEEVEILDDDNYQSMSDMLSVLGADMIVRTLNELEAKGSVPLEPQDSSKATYAPLIEKHEGRIDWSRTTEEIICQIHAMTPWPSAYTRHRGFEIKIVQGEPFEIEPDHLYAPAADIPAGEIVMLVKGRGFAVRTRDGALLVKRVQLPGKKPIEAGALLNAGVIKEGEMLS